MDPEVWQEALRQARRALEYPSAGLGSMSEPAASHLISVANVMYQTHMMTQGLHWSLTEAICQFRNS